MVDKVKVALGSLKGKHIAALGLAYKPDVDDLRESPAAEVVHLLTEAGAEVRAFEPFKLEGLPGIQSFPTFESAIENAEAIILLVRHTEFVKLNPAHLLELTPARIVIVTVGGWDVGKWDEAGFRVVRLGVNK